MPPDPPNRGHLSTEQRNPSSAALDALSVEQALRLMNTQDMDVGLRVRDAIPAITKLVTDIVEGMREGGRLIYVGAGSSGRLGVLDASEIPPTFHLPPGRVIGLIAGGDSALRTSSEGEEDRPDAFHEELKRLRLTGHDTLVGIAAGGTTPCVWGAIAFAGERGARTAIMCCVPVKSLMTRSRAAVVPANQTAAPPPPPSLPAPVDHRIELLTGAEVVTGSTRMKAGTATKLALNMITTTTMVRLGKVWGNLMVDLRATNAKLRDRALRILVTQTGLDRSAAGDLLDRAEGRVKLALVMHKLDCDAEEAERQLANTGQQLRPILGSPR